jgi:hypothetical protein
MIIEDADGNNLLDPGFEGNIIDKITLTYNYETFKIENSKENIYTKNGSCKVSIFCFSAN